MDGSSCDDALDWPVLLPDDTFYPWEGIDFDADFLTASGEDFDFLFPRCDTPDGDELYKSAPSSLGENNEPIPTIVSRQFEVSDTSDFDGIVLTPISPTEAAEEGKRVSYSASAFATKDLLYPSMYFEDEEHHCKPKKRKWEESVIIFSSEPNGTTQLRKRNAFDDARRREVALNRRVGACVQCKLRRARCNFGIPCNACTKRAGNLAQELCTRQGLVAARFNNVDLLGITHYKNFLGQQCRALLKGTSREMYLFWPNCCTPYSSAQPLIKLCIQDFTESPAADKVTEPTQTFLYRRYTDCIITTAPDRAWAIVSDSLPSLEQLTGCCIDSDHCCNAGPFARLHKTFGKFGARYCQEGTNLPLQDLMRKVLHMKRTFSIFRRAACLKDSAEATESEFVGTWIKAQLKHHIAIGIMELEAEIFDELDRLLYGPDGIGKRNPLATWVCLWTLVLAYKEQMAFIYFHYRNEPAQLQTLYGCAKHIYNTLTSIYAALYKTTSPLTLDWRKEEISSEMLGGDSELIRLFYNIKTEMYWFHAKRDQLFPEDALFKSLIVENESKLLESHKKIAKKQGIL
ncbi:hypothetical protein BDZ45DRAFT_680506 [Acephala macrosclerotiorum]|nr:hypothetical protein BDZ45DRAFT_680506 [Acephala macrosclerotiorum]